MSIRFALLLVTFSLWFLPFCATVNVCNAAEDAYTFRFSGADSCKILPGKDILATLQTEYDDSTKGTILRVDYSLAKTGNDIISLLPQIDPGQKFSRVDTVKIKFKGTSKNARLQIELRDVTGEVFIHQNFIQINNENWATANAVFSDPKKLHHWGGNKDGVMNPPLKVAAIRILCAGTTNQTVRFHSITVDTDYNAVEKATEKPSNVVMKIDEVGSLIPVKPTDNPVLKSRLKNTGSAAKTVEIVAEQRMLLSDFKKEAKIKADLIPGQESVSALPLSFTLPGVHKVRITVRDGDKELTGETAVNVWNPAGNSWKDTPETFFGCQEALDLMGMKYNTDQDLANMRDAGVKVLRFVLRWNTIEAEKGKFDWKAFDKVFADCKKYNIIPYPMLVYSPKWAIDPELLKKSPAFVRGWVPANLNDYTNFASKAVERYKDYTKYWEIWNEPYAEHFFWGGTQERYAEMLKAAYTAIKAVDPEAKVNSGACFLDTEKWGEPVYRLSIGYFDNWPFHCHDEVPVLRKMIKRYKELMGDKYRPEVMWCDETGFIIDPKDPESEITRSRIVIQKLTVSRAEGLGNHTWFMFRNFPEASLNPADNFPALDHLGRLRPVVLAHSNAARWLHNTKCIKAYSFGELGDAYLFERTGEKILVMWGGEFAQGQVIRITFSGKVSAELYDLFGGVKNVETDGTMTLSVSSMPSFLVMKDNVDLKSVTMESLFSIPKQFIIRKGVQSAQAKIGIRNILEKPFKGVIKLGSNGGWKADTREIPFDLEPGKSTDISIAFTCATKNETASVDLPYTIVMNNQGTLKGEFRFIASTTLKKVSANDITNGKVKEWNDSMLLKQMNTKESIRNLRLGDMDSNMFWQGPSDLSGKLYGAWDNNNLYLALLATDDIHYQVRNDSGIWDGDSLQIAISNMKEKNIQVGIAITNSGEKVFRQYWCNFSTTPKYDISNQGKDLLYEITIPWKELGVIPDEGVAFSMSTLLNDNDARVRKVLMEWGGGIYGTASEALYRPVILSK